MNRRPGGRQVPGLWVGGKRVGASEARPGRAAQPSPARERRGRVAGGPPLGPRAARVLPPSRARASGVSLRRFRRARGGPGGRPAAAARLAGPAAASARGEGGRAPGAAGRWQGRAGRPRGRRPPVPRRREREDGPRADPPDALAARARAGKPVSLRRPRRTEGPAAGPRRRVVARPRGRGWAVRDAPPRRRPRRVPGGSGGRGRGGPGPGEAPRRRVGGRREGGPRVGPAPGRGVEAGRTPRPGPAPGARRPPSPARAPAGRPSGPPFFRPPPPPPPRPPRRSADPRLARRPVLPGGVRRFRARRERGAPAAARAEGPALCRCR